MLKGSNGSKQAHNSTLCAVWMTRLAGKNRPHCYHALLIFCTGTPYTITHACHVSVNVSHKTEASQIDPVHAPPSHFFFYFNFNFNIILPSTSGSFKWSPSLKFPYQNPLHISPLPHMCYMPYSSVFLI